MGNLTKMKNSTSSADQEFKRQFESGEIPGSDLNH